MAPAHTRDAPWLQGKRVRRVMQEAALSGEANRSVA